MTLKRTLSGSLCFLCLVLAPRHARAQFGAVPFSDPATGERYHIEASGSLWNPAPQLTVASEAAGIAGTEIDAVKDLGIQQARFGEVRLALRPGRKHKFRLHYLPMQYTAESTVLREFVFNGERYRIGLPVATDLKWDAWRIGYEYDFTYHDRWFAGFLFDIKYTDVSVDLQSLVAQGHARARGPIPTIGGIVRVYAVPNISVTGELTALKIPDTIDEDYRAHYFDFDLYGTVNFNDYVGAQVGYRSIDVDYKIEGDTGTFVLRGLYFGGVIRY